MLTVSNLLTFLLVIVVVIIFFVIGTGFIVAGWLMIYTFKSLKKDIKEKDEEKKE